MRQFHPAWHIAAIAALALVTLGLALVARNVSGDETVQIGAPADTIYIGTGLYDPETSKEQGAYRWASPSAQINLVGWGPGRIHVVLSGVAGGPATGNATLLFDDTTLDSTPLQPGQPWTLQAWLPTTSRDPVLTVQSPALSIPGENRSLGVLVKQLAIFAPDARTHVLINLALLAITALLLYVALLTWFGKPLLALFVAAAVPALYGPLVVYRDLWLSTVVWVSPVVLLGLLLADTLRGNQRPRRASKHKTVLVVLALTFALLLLAMGTLNAFDADRMYDVAAGLGEYGRPSRYPSLEGYTKYGFGLPLIAVPFYWLGKIGVLLGATREPITRFTVSMTNLPVTALTCWLLYRASRRFARTGVAVAVAGTYLLSTMALNYGRTFFSEPPGGALLLGACLLILDWGFWILEGEKNLQNRQSKIRNLVWAGLLLGLMIWLKPAFAIFLPVPGLVVLVIAVMAARRDAPSRPAQWLKSAVLSGLLFSVGPLFALAVQAGYNWLRYSPLADAWLRTGYEKEEGFVTPLWEGLGGLLFSPGKSLFLFAPPLVLAPIGLWLMLRHRSLTGRVAAVLILAETLVSLVFNATWWAWTGNFAWGPRLIVPILPLLAWALAPLGEFAMTRVQHSKLSPRLALLGLWGVLAVLGALVSIPGAMVDFQLYFREHGLLLAGDPGENVTIYDPAQSPLLQEPGYLLNGVTAAIQRPTLASTGLPAIWDVLVPGGLVVLAVGALWVGKGRQVEAAENREPGV